MQQIKHELNGEKIKIVEFTDIRNKKQRYIMIGDLLKEIIINIGEKNYNNLKELSERNTSDDIPNDLEN